MHRALLTIAVVGLLAAGCSDSGTASTEPPATTAPAPTAAATAPPTTVAAATTVRAVAFDFTLPGPAPERVELSTSDGVPIVVDLYRGGERAFVIGHGNNQDRSAHDPLAAALHRAGHTVVNVDFRGHGESGGDGVARGIVNDLDAAARLARAAGAAEVYVVGVQMGGTAALQMAIDGSGEFSGVLAMFTPPTYHGLNAELGLDQVTVPTMYFTTDVRGGSVKWAQQLHERAPDPKALLVLPPAPSGAPFYETLGSELVAGMLELFGLV